MSLVTSMMNVFDNACFMVYVIRLHKAKRNKTEREKHARSCNMLTISQNGTAIICHVSKNTRNTGHFLKNTGIYRTIRKIQDALYPL